MPAKENNIVQRTLDLTQPPQLSEAQQARLAALAAMPDEQIDYSDAPSLPDAVWAKVGKASLRCAGATWSEGSAEHLSHTKKQISLRIDAEVLEFFKRTGRRYQSHINAVLRAYVEAHKAHAK